MQMEQDARFSQMFPKIKNDPDRPICWHREDMTKLGERCMEKNCQFVIRQMWRSWLHQEHDFFGFWLPYNCRYVEFRRDELQSCITNKKIASIQVQGASVASFLSEYVDQRLDGITFVQPSTNATTKQIVLNTFKLPHALWHSTANEFRQQLEQMTSIDSSIEEHYYITGFYYSSEREPHVYLDRSLQFSELFEEILQPKGYKQINAFDLTAAFTYDSAGQLDGMHIAGPPMKAIVVKLFHHLCSTVDE